MTLGTRARSAAAGLVSTAATVLLCAGPASASHIDGGSYFGDLPGGGTIELFVAPGGSELDAVTGRNVPSFPAGCGEFIEGTAGDVPITSHAYSVANSSGVTANGSFSSYGTTSGSYTVQASGCSSGPRAFTATIPVDGLIRRENEAPEESIGDGLYSRNGSNQTRRWSARRGQTRLFEVDTANDGPTEETAVVDGCASSNGFKVSYSDGGTDITAGVVAGTHEHHLNVDDNDGLVMKIKAKRGAKVGETKSCKFGAEIDGTRDVVRAQLKVKPG